VAFIVGSAPKSDCKCAEIGFAVLGSGNLTCVVGL
jgi:hypothetical protein